MLGEMYYMFKKILNHARENAASIIEYRREIHKFAEIGFKTDKSVDFIIKKLENLIELKQFLRKLSL